MIRNRHIPVLAASAALLLLITWVDYVTGYEFGFFIFYFVPVSIAAWYAGKRPGLVFAVAAGLCWYLSDRLSHHPYSRAVFIYWETFMRLASFLTTTLTLTRIREDGRRNRVLERELNAARERNRVLEGLLESRDERVAGVPQGRRGRGAGRDRALRRHRV